MHTYIPTYTHKHMNTCIFNRNGYLQKYSCSSYRNFFNCFVFLKNRHTGAVLHLYTVVTVYNYIGYSIDGAHTLSQVHLSASHVHLLASHVHLSASNLHLLSSLIHISQYENTAYICVYISSACPVIISSLFSHHAIE